MRAVALAAGILAIPLLAASAATNAKADGNELLARAVKLNPWPSTYSVPLHFIVHLHRPLPIQHQEREQEPTLLTRQRLLNPLSLQLNGETPTQLNPCSNHRQRR